jgi:hypothetical protein
MWDGQLGHYRLTELLDVLGHILELLSLPPYVVQHRLATVS